MESGRPQFVRKGGGKWGVFGRNDDGSPFYVGPVYSQRAAEQLVDDAAKAGYHVEITGGFSKAEFLDAISTAYPTSALTFEDAVDHLVDQARDS